MTEPTTAVAIREESAIAPFQKLEREIDAVTFEALQVLKKAFRGALDMGDAGNRVLVTTAATAVASRSRDEQSKRASRHSNFGMATVLTAQTDMRLDEAVALTMPDDPIARGIQGRTQRQMEGPAE